MLKGLKIVRDYYEQHYAPNIDNLEEMNKSLDKHRFLKWTQEYVENLNILVSFK